MLAVSPFVTVLGTSPMSSETLFAVHDLISISNSMQSSHSFFGELALIIFLPALFFSSLIVPSGAFCHGEYGSVCLTWQSACLALCLNSPITRSQFRDIIWSYDSLFFLSSGLFTSSSVKCLYDDLYTHLPFSFRIFAHNAGPISVLGPSHLPKTYLLLGCNSIVSEVYPVIPTKLT